MVVIQGQLKLDSAVVRQAPGDDIQVYEMISNMSKPNIYSNVFEKIATRNPINVDIPTTEPPLK